ncbi:MAG: Fe-Mn family superoxide dismutase [Vampirovibrionales bacterium]|nr:Fe-Mn family superoxide dismutase [Vampirovibrionales bacterium]
MSDSSQLTGQLARRDFLKYAGIIGGTALALNHNQILAQAAKAPLGKNKANPLSPLRQGVAAYDQTREIEVKAFSNLLTVEGISQNQLNQHIGLYKAYVKKINDIQAQISVTDPDLLAMNPTYSPYRELHVEQTFALNGAVLHEYYFDNLGGNKTQPSADFESVISKEFGSWDNYVSHFKALGKSARGWVMTAYNLRDHRLHNYLLDAHNQLVPFYVMPVLVMDVYEHAYAIDFGVADPAKGRPAYIDAFLQNADWSKVEERLDMMLWHSDKASKK